MPGDGGADTQSHGQTGAGMSDTESHEGCLERACECVQADLAAAEKGRDYYSGQYAVTARQRDEYKQGWLSRGRELNALYDRIADLHRACGGSSR